jgi:hypothetical protein
VAANTLILHEASPLGDASWQKQMMWIVLNHASVVNDLRAGCQ